VAFIPNFRHKESFEQPRLALKKYFKTVEQRNWVLSAPIKMEKERKLLHLRSASSVTFKRDTKVRGAAHPFDPDFKD